MMPEIPIHERFEKEDRGMTVNQSTLNNYHLPSSGFRHVLVVALKFMMSRKCVLFLVSIVCISCTQTQLPKARFEYKYSFKGPHLVQRDSSVPFWEYIGG